MSRNRKSDDWSRLGFPSGCSPLAWEIRLAAKGLVTESTCYICQGGERWLAEAIDRRTVRLRQKGYLQYGTPSLRRYHAVMHMGVLPYNHEVHHLPDEHGFTDRFRDWDWRRLMVLPQGEHRKLASIYPSRWADSYTGKQAWDLSRHALTINGEVLFQENEAYPQPGDKSETES